MELAGTFGVGVAAGASGLRLKQKIFGK